MFLCQSLWLLAHDLSSRVSTFPQAILIYSTSHITKHLSVSCYETKISSEQRYLSCANVGFWKSKLLKTAKTFGTFNRT